MRAAERTLLHFAAYNALLLAVYPVIAMIFTTPAERHCRYGFRSFS